jgi:hypothetical protein
MNGICTGREMGLSVQLTLMRQNSENHSIWQNRRFRNLYCNHLAKPADAKTKNSYQMYLEILF